MTSTATTYTPGTVVVVADSALPHSDRDGDRTRTLLDPTVYGLTPDDGMGLIASPHGWPTIVRSGQPDAGAEVRVFWVGFQSMTRAATPLTTDLLDGTHQEVLTELTRVRAQRDEATTASATKVAQVVTLTSEMDVLRGRLRSAQNDLESFREQVRTVAIRVAGEQSWCDGGLNGVLEELGLPKKTCAYDLEVEVAFTVTKTVTVRVQEAADEDDARDQVDRGLVEEALNDEGEWPDGDNVDLDDYTIESVTEAD